MNIIFDETGFKISNEKLVVTRDKGKSKILLPDDYTIIDIETTGLMPMCDEIIELSALKIRNNEIADSFTSLVRPEMLEENGLDEFITNLTGITYDMLVKQKTSKEILPDFVKFIGNDLLVGYNINFDINFIYDEYYTSSHLKFNNDFVDLMRIVKKHCKELKNHKLATVAEYYNINSDNAHRGLEDCKITYEVYKCVKNEILSKYSDVKSFYKQEWCAKHNFIVSSNCFLCEWANQNCLPCKKCLIDWGYVNCWDGVINCEVSL